jgi:hypothetical protein
MNWYRVLFYADDGLVNRITNFRAVNDRVACSVVLNELVSDNDCAGWRMWKDGDEIQPIESDFK